LIDTIYPHILRHLSQRRCPRSDYSKTLPEGRSIRPTSGAVRDPILPVFRSAGFFCVL